MTNMRSIQLEGWVDRDISPLQTITAEDQCMPDLSELRVSNDQIIEKENCPSVEPKRLRRSARIAKSKRQLLV